MNDGNGQEGCFYDLSVSCSAEGKTEERSHSFSQFSSLGFNGIYPVDPIEMANVVLIILENQNHRGVMTRDDQSERHSGQCPAPTCLGLIAMLGQRYCCYCINHFHHCYDKIPVQSSLRKKRVILAHSLRMQSILGNIMAAGA